MGIWNTIFGYLAFVAAYSVTRWLDIHYMWSYIPAHLMAVGNAWLCQRTFVFGKGDLGAARSFLRFSSVYWVQFAINLVMLPLLVELTGVSPLIVQAFIVGTAAFVNYTIHARWSFARRDVPPPRGGA